ncbi:MAG: FAD-dependent oxidoreductase [Oscillospiraceae bacterium]|jgi:2,4-dienoyl-CoA reductase-like NADH-dependent reductase (Old Yellow Enzyme family)/thioredoxin reductase|nr:FAD-dependent oxidoreductase [Oscillospiraceae bacterium]
MPYTPKYPNLMRPLRIGGVTLNHRIASAPMGFPDITHDGCITSGMTAFYELRARGGASIVTVSEAMTHVTGRTHGRVIDLTNPDVIASLTNTARAIRRHGAIASIELNHGGKSQEMDASGDAKIGSDDAKSSINEMSVKFIREIVRSFGDGAALCKRAGFDMITIHGGHGWLIHQFLSPEMNHRTDEYGGSPENNARIAIEIIDAVRRAVGRGFPIEFRMSAVGGYDLEYAIAFAKLIERKIDLLHVSAGFGEDDFSVTHPSMFAPHGVNVHYAAAIKRAVTVPVATVGALNDPEKMEEIIASGQADIVCLARALLADNDLPKKVVQNRDDEIRYCLRCFVCHAERMLTQTRICSVNPIIGREEEFLHSEHLTFPNTPTVERDINRRVLVVGGGPAGLTAALHAARRGFAVTLCERGASLGGALLAERGIDFKQASIDFVRTMETRLSREGVSIRLGVEVTPELVRLAHPDALIVAVGAEPIIPTIPGIDGKNVIIASKLPDEMQNVGNIVAVLGGGLVGCETAVHLKNLRRSVTIVEMGEQFASDANPRHRPILMRELRNVEQHTRTRAIEVTKAGLRCTDMYGMEVMIPANTIIVAAGQRPRRDTADSLRGLVANTSFIGDCVSARNIREATFRGYHAALDL